MLYANSGGKKARATPGARATCPGCGAEVLAKCGEINIWHWSHVSSDCDSWYEPESAWHLGWKVLAPPDRCEVRMGSHRADIVTPSDFILELQHSPLDPQEVRERESFYGSRLIWVLDASDFIDNLTFRDRGTHWSFRWRWPRKWQFSVARPLVWDFGDDEDLFLVKRLHAKLPCGGWGRFFSRSDFVSGHFGGLISSIA